MKRNIITRENLGVLFVVLISVFMNFFRLKIEGYANLYYAAGVKSMLESWKNLFFISFDPGGFVSIDKPPLGFWIQALSAKIFGFSGWSLIFPQSLAGVLSVLVLYHLVKRSFGIRAGLVSSFFLAITPIFVAINRNNTVDSLLILVLLLCAWAVSIAAERGSLKHLLLGAVLLGLAFNIKMLQAYMVLPGLYLVYLLSGVISWKKKIIHLIIASLVIVVISLSWAVAVDSMPPDERPYVGSSNSNSVIELMTGHNGISRLFIKRPGGFSAGKPWGNSPVSPPGKPPAGSPAVSRPGNQPPGNPPPGSPPLQGPTDNEAGSPGVFRLFNKQLGAQISWFAPLVLFGLIFLVRKPKRLRLLIGRKELSLSLWLGWMLPVILFFSFTSGIFHRYYLAMLAPVLAALSGIGLTVLWKRRLLPAAVISCGALQILFLSYYAESSGWLIPITGAVFFLAAAGLIIYRLKAVAHSHFLDKAVFLILIVILSSVPTIWSLTILTYGGDSALPHAGPELAKSGRTPVAGMAKLVDFLLTNNRGEKYIVATSSALTCGADLILETGEPVMALGGFNGSDRILSVEKFITIIKEGVLRYVLLPDGDMDRHPGKPPQKPPPGLPLRPPGGPEALNELTIWIKQNGTAVPDKLWKEKSPHSNLEHFKLYDLKSTVDSAGGSP